MPTYEYICDACGNEFEKFQSMSAAPVKKCPSCGKNKVQRKISVGAGIIFKGGGFYETDYRNEAYKKAAEADKAGGENKPADTSKPDAKSDGKSDAKSDAAAKPAEAKPTSPPSAPAAAEKSASKSEPAAKQSTKPKPKG